MICVQEVASRRPEEGRGILLRYFLHPRRLPAFGFGCNVLQVADISGLFGSLAIEERICCEALRQAGHLQRFPGARAVKSNFFSLKFCTRTVYLYLCIRKLMTSAGADKLLFLYLIANK